MKDIIVIGAGGHSKSAIDVLESSKEYKILGIVDNELEIGSMIGDHTILGADSDLPKLKDISSNVLIGVGQIKNPNIRSDLYLQLKQIGFEMPSIISKTAIVSDKAEIGDGSIIMNGVIINAGATIGSNCIINTGAIVEHDVKIGNNTHVSTNSVINGDAKIGDLTFIGSGSVIRNGISIGNECIISMGSIVHKSVDDHTKTI